jgi:thioredoxin reductase
MQIYGEYYIVVVGGRSSGVSAAIASARVGAKNLLIERLGALGSQIDLTLENDTRPNLEKRKICLRKGTHQNK